MLNFFGLSVGSKFSDIKAAAKGIIGTKQFAPSHVAKLKEFSKIRSPKDKQMREGDSDRNSDKGIFSDFLKHNVQLIKIIKIVINIANSFNPYFRKRLDFPNKCKGINCWGSEKYIKADGIIAIDIETIRNNKAPLFQLLKMNRIRRGIKTKKFILELAINPVKIDKIINFEISFVFNKSVK